MNMCITVHDLMYCTNLVEPVFNAIREWVYSISHEALKIKVHDVIKVLVI